MSSKDTRLNYLNSGGYRSGRSIAENGDVVNFADIMKAFYDAGMMVSIPSDQTGANRTLATPDNPFPVTDPWLGIALHEIAATTGDVVSVHEKHKTLFKFGRSDQVQTASTGKTTIMTLPAGTYNETYVSDNLITHISSGSTLDTQEIVIEGHTIDGNGDFTFIAQTKTLQGQTKVPLDTPLARATRAYNNDSTDLVAPVYIYEDDTVSSGVPQTGSKVHLMIREGENQSEKASTTVSSIDYWILTEVYLDMLSKNDYNVEASIEIREKGKVFRKQFDLSAGKGNSDARTLIPYIIVKPNSDVRVTSISSNANTIVAAGVGGVLAKVVE